ncbi:hypothetical protein GCM10007392_25560 [Saccharospirillum salsuginis]|uniref:Polysaccharide lyase n=2 Tax=Saccharospirillum salsuginis TaxID=418750 RepID=A0A918NC57_9GAMM|nr:hypothetical protein GCM10007392_25560 [Saccharospirillum salsuginis]
MALPAWPAPFFSDGFESGTLDHTEPGVQYGSSIYTSVTNERARTGQFALRFTFKGGATGEDAWSEQRLSFPDRTELWIAYDLYVPLNYAHRTESGASNNKFLAIYRAPYTDPGFHLNWSVNPDGDGGSNLFLHRYRNGTEQAARPPADDLGVGVLTADDRGQWVRIEAFIRVPSSADSNDGVMRMWKNGTLVTDETALNNYGGDDENYFNELYLLGWSNSGFDEDTVLYIDNLSLSEQSLAAPKPPRNPTIRIEVDSE